MKVWRQTDSCWFQTVQVGSRLQSRQGHLGHLSSSSQCLFLIQILFVTSLHTIASYQTGELKVETQLPIFPVPHTHASSFQESQSWGPAMKDTVGKLEASPAGQWNPLWFLSRNKRNLKKPTHTHIRELFRGENICHCGQNESPTKWNKRLWKKTCHSRERTTFLLPCSLLSFCALVYKALFVCSIIFSSTKEAWINFSL